MDDTFAKIKEMAQQYDDMEKEQNEVIDLNAVKFNTFVLMAESLQRISEILYDLTYVGEVERREKHRHKLREENL